MTKKNKETNKQKTKQHAFTSRSFLNVSVKNPNKLLSKLLIEGGGLWNKEACADGDGWFQGQSALSQISIHLRKDSRTPHSLRVNNKGQKPLATTPSS